jgi:alcohol dehydrogenase class IV
MNFDFSTSNRIIFGQGTLKIIPELVKVLGKNVLIVKSPYPTGFDQLITLLETSGKLCSTFIIENEPTIIDIENAVLQARDFSCDFVVALGGGSVIDTGKAIAALLTNTGILTDYLEIVGKALPITKPPAPLIAVPTTAGEVTRNAVIGVPEKHIKVSMRSVLLLPKVALVDPELTLSVPANITAHTGMDAFVQVLEPYVSIKANPLTDMFCREGIQKAAQSLLKAYKDGKDIHARVDMSWVSLLGGLCLANAGLGAVHGFAAPIGGMFTVPHGAICASLLTSVMNVNVEAMIEREPQNPALTRYKEISCIITKNSKSSIIDGIEWIKNLCLELKVPRLSELGIEKESFERIIPLAQEASSMKANPIQLNEQELFEILDQSE